MRIINIINSWLKLLVENINKRRKVVLALSCLIVFITTYMLILPAFTLEKTEAEEQGGIDLPVAAETTAEELVPEEEPADSETVAEPEEKEAEAEEPESEVEQPAETTTKDSADASGNEGDELLETAEDNEEAGEVAEEVTEESVDKEEEIENEEEKEKDAEKSDPLTYEGEGYRITLIDEKHVLPENTEILVDEIDKDGKENKEDKELFKQYFDETIQAFNDDEETPQVEDLEFAKFYNISLVSNDKEIKAPKDTVSIKIEYDDELAETMKVEKTDNLQLINFVEDKSKDEVVPEILEAKKLKVNTDKKNRLEDATFEAERFTVEDSFSLYGIVYIVEKEEKAEEKSEEKIEENKTDPLTYVGDNYRVIVEDKDHVLPENTEIRVKEIDEKKDAEAYKQYYDESVQAVNDDKKTPDAGGLSFARFYDITLVADGTEITTPEDSVSVRIEYDDVLSKEMNIEDKDRLQVIHFAEDEKTGEIKPEVLEKESVEVNTDKKDNLTDTSFEAASFSVYGVVYTVDFHWEVNGKTYQFSLPGGGFVSFTDLVEVLGITADTNSADNTAENTVDEKDTEDVSLTLDDVNVSEETRKFVADVETVEFSNPNLVWVGKAENDSTVGKLKETNKLECQYSAELTDEQIEEINSQTVDAGDWALISIQPFTSEESLTVTMKNGDQFEIRVTDRAYGDADRANVTVPNLNGLMTVNMFNYGPSSSLDSMNNSYDNGHHVSGDGINSYSDLKFVGYGSTASQGGQKYNAFTGGPSVYQDVVNRTLPEDGYPTQKDTEESLDYLFDESPRAWRGNATGAKSVDANVQGLFYKANSDGSANNNGSYYAYDSDRYYAYLNGSNVELYNTYKFNAQNYWGGIGVDPSVNGDGFTNKGIGFFPYTKPNDSNVCPHPRDVNWHNNWHNELRGYYDHQFGLSMSAKFEMPLADENGKQTVDGNNMIFSFSGDDDMWVFIDDVLVLDIGGLHHPSSGYIDFTNGVVHLDNSVYSSTGINKNNATVKIADIFNAAGEGKKWVSDGHSAHTIKVFYLERGGIYSNCKITFNLPLVLGKGTARIVKKDADPNNTTNDGKLEGAIFGLWKNENCTGDPFMTRVSESNGICTFADLSVGDDLDNLVFYMKEIQAPYGYKLDDTIYRMKLIPDSSDVSGYKRDAEGNYIFQLLDQDGSSIQVLDQEPRLPYIENELAEDIGLKVQKKWQNADNVTVYVDPPEGVTAKFRIKRYRSYNVIELGDDNIHRIIDSKRELDTAFNSDDSNTVQMPIEGSQTPWDYVFNNLKVAEEGSVSIGGKTYPVQFYYEYFIEESDTPEGYETIYLDGEDNEISEDDVQNMATNQADQSQTIINRELLDVPVKKYWPDYSGNQYDWTAGFQLEYMEVKVNNEDEAAEDAVTEFTPIDGKLLTISKNTDPSDAVFSGLPMYKEHSNGTMYRIVYSVREMSYVVTKTSDSSVVIQWYRDNSKPTIGLRYTPQFEQDAGENGADIDDYKIILINTLENRSATKEIDLDITKVWPEGALDDVENPYAKFTLKRYVHEEYVDFSKVQIDSTWVDITLETGNGEPQTLHVPQGWTMHIVGNVKGSTNADSIQFSQTDGSAVPAYSYDNSSNKNQHAFSIEFTADTTKTITLTDGAEFVAGGADGFRLTEMNDQNTRHVDSGFEEEFTLNNANEWYDMISHLSVIEEDDHAENATNITRHVYEYFLVENSSNPSDYYATFKAGDGSTYYLSGDAENVIDFTTSLSAENKLKPGALKVSKVVKVDGGVPTAENAYFTNGTYNFQLFESDGTTPAKTAEGEAIGDISITYANGTVTDPETGYALISNLEPGNYVLKEVSIPNGMSLTAAKRGDNEASAVNLTEQTINVIVKAGDASASDAKAQGEFTNNIDTGKLQIRKEVTYNGRTPDANHKSELAGRYTFKLFTDEALKNPYQENGVDKTISLTIGEDGEAKESDVLTVPVGTYWIQEVESTNPYTFPVENPIEVNVELGATVSSDAIKTFTNNKDVNDNPDKITLDIEKTFTGLLSKDDIPDGYEVTLSYKIGNDEYTIPLKNVAIYTEGDNHVKWSADDTGLIWSWHVSNIDSRATDFKILESNYTDAEGYIFSNAKLDNNPWSEPGSATDLSVTAPTAEFNEVTEARRYTPDNKKSFIVNGNEVLLVSLTASAGTLVVSDRSLNTLERQAITDKIPLPQGSFAQPVTFFSIEEHPNEFYYHKGWIEIKNVENVGNVVTIGHNQSSQEAVFQITYNSEETFNNAEIENAYTQASTELDVFKVDKTAADQYLEGAVFTLKEIDETKTPVSGLPVYKQDDNGQIIQRDSAPTTKPSGKTTFTNLAAGYYEISEKTAPSGYTLATDAVAYFKVERGEVIRLKKDSEKKPSEWVKQTDDDEWISFKNAKKEVAADPSNGIEAAAAENASFTVKNEPGVALPMTGGVGTTIFYVFGTILVLVCGVYFIARRRVVN